MSNNGLGLYLKAYIFKWQVWAAHDSPLSILLACQFALASCIEMQTKLSTGPWLSRVYIFFPIASFPSKQLLFFSQDPGYLDICSIEEKVDLLWGLPTLWWAWRSNFCSREFMVHQYLDDQSFTAVCNSRISNPWSKMETFALPYPALNCKDIYPQGLVIVLAKKQS